jgi:hypothetical protein
LGSGHKGAFNQWEKGNFTKALFSVAATGQRFLLKCRAQVMNNKEKSVRTKQLAFNVFSG